MVLFFSDSKIRRHKKVKVHISYIFLIHSWIFKGHFGPEKWHLQQTWVCIMLFSLNRQRWWPMVLLFFPSLPEAGFRFFLNTNFNQPKGQWHLQAKTFNFRRNVENSICSIRFFKISFSRTYKNYPFLWGIKYCWKAMTLSR